MKTFSAWQYLLIDACNNNWLDGDKIPFEQRIAWTTEHLNELESLAATEEWKHKPQYLKAVMAIRDAQQGKAIGHLVGLDAICSGMQIASVLTGCVAGATATGLVDPDVRSDAYTDCNSLVSQYLGQSSDALRDATKKALMTALYGSRAEPKKLFGEDTPELEAFYKAMVTLAPGACQLLQALLDSWNPWALYHAWKLPDGYDAKVKVMQQKEKRIEVDELSSSFTYVYYENEGEESGVKNAANVVHSFDAYVLRSLVRRCNYNADLTRRARRWLSAELAARRANCGEQNPSQTDVGIQYYLDQYQRSSVADVVILPYLTQRNIMAMSTQHLQELIAIIDTMLEHKPFAVITVHDDFKCHPNYCNYLRKHYRNILAELADSSILDDVLSQLYGQQGTFPKLSNNLGDLIRKSNYGLT